MMFRFRPRESEPIDWPSLHSLLEDDDRRAAIEMLHPNESRESFLNGLRRLDPPLTTRLLAAGRQLHTASQLVDWPTVAIAGMLNSGKTSLVATFLSEAGRARTLRGANNAQGTHRFVIWLPSAWQQDAELWGLLISRIGDAVGQPPEMLSEDPQQPHHQYNNRGETNTRSPYRWWRPTSDSIRSASACWIVRTLSPTRRSVWVPPRSVGSCSVGRRLSVRPSWSLRPAESSRDGTLGDLLRIASDLMPGVPRMLAVNKIRREQTPDQVLETFRPLARSHGIETIYAAYDFDVPSSQPFIPGMPTSRTRI